MVFLLRFISVLLLVIGLSHVRIADSAPGASILPVRSFILVATPSMTDRYFYRTVVAVTSHGDTGYIGLILNRPESVTLDNLLPEYKLPVKPAIFNGGPNYPDHLFYIVRGAGTIKGAAPFSDNEALAFNLPVLEDLLSGKRNHNGLRVMHGMATWMTGQLENEISHGIWRVKPFDDSMLFDRDPIDLWQQMQGIEL